MKTKTKKTVWTVIFLAFALAAILTLLALTIFNTVRTDIGGDRTVYQSTELVRVKRGDKIAFADTNADFARIVQNDGDDVFQVHSYGAYCLNDTIMNNSSGEVDCNLLMDKDGNLHALGTGIYQVEYNFVKPEDLGTQAGERMDKYDTYTFTSLVCVYEEDESVFLPFPDSAEAFEKGGRERRNYILTKDIVWETDEMLWEIGSFYGTILNPYGYTITWKIDERTGGGRKQAFIGNNHGYIDGLNLRVVGSEKKPLVSHFYGLVERNFGLIQNCTVEGAVYIEGEKTSYDPATFFALPAHGFSYNNVAKMTVYSNNDIRPYAEGSPPGTDRIAVGLWEAKDNAVYLDAWWFEDEVKARRRAVETISRGFTSNTCEHLLFGMTGWKHYDVTMKIPVMQNHGVPTYETMVRRYLSNSPLELDWEDKYRIRWSSYGNSYDNLEVKYWLVDGEKKENLDDVLVTEDLTIEPFVQYKKNVFTDTYKTDENGAYKHTLNGIYNVEDVLEIPGDFEKDGTVHCSLLQLCQMFRDPRNVIPSTIIINENCDFSEEKVVLDALWYDFDYFLEYLVDGGRFVVENGNPSVSFIGNKMLCSGDGTELYYYFDTEGERDITLHSQIKSIRYTAFWNGERYRSLDLTDVTQLNRSMSQFLPNLQEIKFGESLSFKNYSDTTSVIRTFLADMEKLEKVEIAEGNPALRAESSFVCNAFGKLLYAPRTLTGEVRVPEGVVSLEKDAFCGSDISHLIFPDSLEDFTDLALDGMKNLQKITFGNAKQITATQSSSGAEIPNLLMVEFGEETERLAFGVGVFEQTQLYSVVLPKNLMEAGLFNTCAKFIIDEGNAYYKTVDGVLYSRLNPSLCAYPSLKEDKVYEVLDGTEIIVGSAFRKAQVQEVVLPESLWHLNADSFYNSAVERVQIKYTDTVYIDTRAFGACDALSAFEVADKTKLRLGSDAFKGCESLRAFPYQNVVSIGREAFYNSGIEYFEIHGDVEYLGYNAFRASALKEVKFAQELKFTEIQSGVFGNTPLTSVDLGGITSLAQLVFENCEQLKTVDLTRITQIGLQAFLASGLESVNSETVADVGGGAFAQCSGLKSVYLPNVVTLSGSTFKESGVRSVAMPKLCVLGACEFEDCAQLSNLIIAEQVSVGDRCFTGCETLQSFPFEVTSLGVEAFKDCSALTTISVQGNVTAEAVGAFWGCAALESVTLVGAEMTFPQEFFAGCISLQRVTIEQTGENGGWIQTSAFGNASQTVEVYLHVSQGFLWVGKVPANVRLFVPAELLEEFRENWLVESEQIQAYAF